MAEGVRHAASLSCWRAGPGRAACSPSFERSVFMARDVEAVLSAIVQTADGLIAGAAARSIASACSRGGDRGVGRGGRSRAGRLARRRRGRRRPRRLAEACEAVGEACASTGMVFLMHSVAAAACAGRGRRPGRRGAAVDGGGRRDRDARLQRTRHGRALLRARAPRCPFERLSEGLGPQELRHLGRPRGRLPRAAAGEAEGTADAYLVRGDQPASASTASGRASGWPATRASRSSSTASS